jgi:Fe-S-cluster containining protein
LAHSCDDCTAKCCRYFSFEIDKPVTYEEFENVRWFLMHEGVSIFVDEGDWYISMRSPCRELSSQNRCGDYDNRPIICRTYSTKACDHAEGSYQYEHEFKTQAELETYVRELLGEEQFLKARDQARAAAK